MRIGMMAEAYKPHVSGITTYIALNKKFLEQAGHEVYVFTFGEEDQAVDEANVIRSPGIPLVDTGYYLSLHYNRPARKLLYTMDIVHVHHPFLSGTLALRYCRPRNIPIVFTNHTRYDLYAQYYLSFIPDTIGEAALKAYLPTFCRSIDLVIAPSPGMKEVLEHFGVDVPIEVIPNGVDLDPLQSPVTPVSRAEIGFAPNNVLLVYTGRLGPEKNLAFLLRSFSGAAEAYDHIRLLIVGDGPERENLEDRAQHMGLASKIHFTGMVPYEKMPGYLAMADAFVTASVTEVHPLSVIEAMAAGLPVLGIRSPGISDTIVDGQTGYLTSNDLAAFTAKMIRLATEHETRREMGENARQAAEIYSIRRTTQLMLEQYQRLTASARGRKRGLYSRFTRFVDRWT